MTPDTDERRARAVDNLLGPIVAQSEKIQRLLDGRRKLVANIARAIRASDEAAGMVLVPREATEEMAREGARAFRDFYSEAAPYPRAKSVYRAMIAATEADNG